MLSALKRKLKEYHIHPSKRLGQTFLIDKKVIKKVIKTASLQKKDIVLEIGPGLGALTKEIVQKAGKVIAIEKDRKMCEVLKKELKESSNIKVVNKDILKNYELRIKNYEYKIIANLPFYISAPAIRKFLESEKPPKEMILIVQKEVAQRMCASPPKMNPLALSVQFYSKPEIIDYISKKSFWPTPKVDSAIIRITPRLNKNTPARSATHSVAGGPARRRFAPSDAGGPDEIFRQNFSRIVKAGFSHPRKQLASNLSNKLKLNKEKINFLLIKNNIRPSQRAETLTVQDWIKLSKMLK